MIDINATLVAQVINFLILLAILSKLAYKPILSALEARRSSIEKSLEEAVKQRVLAETLKQESQDEILAARIQARAIIEEAIALGEKSKDGIIQKALEENERLVREAQEELERSYQQALNKLRAEIAVMAVAAAEKIIEKNLDAESNTRLVKKFIKNFTREKYGELT